MPLISLPSIPDMYNRLVAVNDTQHLRDHFFPELLRGAGRYLEPEAVATLFYIAFNDHTKGQASSCAVMLILDIPDYIDAIVHEPKLADQVKDHFAELLEAEKET